MEWRRICDDLGKPTKDRLQALELLLEHMDSNLLDVRQKGELVDLSSDLLADNNRKVSQLTLEALAKMIIQSPDGLKTYVKFLVHHAADKLADTNQLVRQSACNVLLALAAAFSADAVRERMSRWFGHKSWRARHGVVQLFAETVERHGYERTEANINYVESALRLLEDSDNTVRDATAEFLQEVYKLWGEPLLAQCQNSLRPAQLSLLYTKLEEGGLVLPVDSSAEVMVLEDESDTVMLSNMLIKGQHNSIGRGQEDFRGASDQARQASGRRGGFKDAGGVTANGALPETEAIAVHSERELREEMEQLPARLAITVAWDQRVEAMVRLEGLAKGAGSFQDQFVELLKPLKDVLTQQVNDRRSAVSRQACHMLGAMACIFGSQFEPFAVHFFPVLIRVAIITVQVIAEAAELCVRVILQHCESPRLLPLIADTLQKERNNKVRMLCSLSLLMVLELWHPETYLRSVDAIEAAMAKALQDASSETRRNARDAYGAYVHSCPEQAAAFYKRVDRDLQDKMDDATRAYIMGERLSSGSWSSQSSVGGRTAGGSVAGASTSSRTSSFSRPASQGDAPTGPPSRALSRQASSLGPERAPLSTRDGGYFRKAQGDELAASVDSLVLTGSVNAGSAVKANGVMARKSRVASGRVTREDGGTPRMQASRPAAGSQSRGYGDHPTPSGQAPAALSREASYMEYGGQPKPVSVAKVVNTLLAEGKSWSEKVEALGALRDVLTGNLYGDPGELGRELERAQVRLIECVEDAHFRVVQAGLEALAAALSTAPRLFEPQLDRIMSVLFIKMIDAKEVIRSAARETLDVCSKKCSADSIMSGVVRAVEAMKVPKSRMAVMEFAAASIGTHASAGPPSISMHLKQWVSKLVPMLSDKNGEVRRVAVSALRSVYTNVDHGVILAALAATNGANAIAMKRALLPVAPDIESQALGSPTPHHRASRESADLQVYIAAARRPSTHPDPRASPTHAPASPAFTADEPTEYQRQMDPPSTPPASPQHHAADPLPYPGVSSSPAMPALQERSRHHAATCQEPTSTSQPDNRGHLSPVGPRKHPHTSYATPTPAWQQRIPAAYPKTPLGTSALPMTPEDPAIQAMQLRKLLKEVGHQQQGGAASFQAASQLEALLEALLDAVRSTPDPVWEGRMDDQGSYAQGVLRVVAPLAGGQSDECREHAARVLRDMARHHPSLMPPLLATFIPALLTFCSDTCPEVLMTANEGLDAIAGSAPPSACLDCLLEWLPVDSGVEEQPSGEANPQTSVIKAIQKVVQRMPGSDLSPLLQPALLPGLFTAINHERTEVRKAAVFCLVEMWAALGERLSPHLEALNMTQRKLLTFYFTRRQEQASSGR